jgi:hypothetical protein
MNRIDKTLQALVDRIIPADDYPSGWQVGVGDFIGGILATDLKSSVPLVEAGLDPLQQESRARYTGADFADLPAAAQDALIEDLLTRKTTVDWALPPDQFALLMIRLSMQGFYGDPDNGGNRDAVSWSMVKYHMLPEGAAWPKVDETPPRTTSWDSIADRYDAIVVGAGAGGGIAACVLAEAGHRVLLIERGGWLTANDLRPDHLRTQRMFIGTPFGYDTPAGPPTRGNPRVFSTARGDVVVWPTDPRWHNNAMTVGVSGSLHPEDLKTARFISEKAIEWVKASGAKTVIPFVGAVAEGPSGGQHQAGTCRMGTDPDSSVTDAWGTVWGHDNLHIVDGSLHVTNGGVNPVLTIMALAYRVSQHVADMLAVPRRT